MKRIIIIIFISNILNSSTFEQNGVKEGNSRVSIGIFSEKHYEKDKNGLDIKFDGTYGRFITNSSEILLKIKDSTDLTYHTYKIDSGYSYYIFKQPTLSPYIGFELGISGNTRVDSKKIVNEEGLYLGLHKFFTEHIAITPEFGVEFTNFNRTTESYFNIYLTYFFD